MANKPKAHAAPAAKIDATAEKPAAEQQDGAEASADTAAEAEAAAEVASEPTIVDGFIDGDTLIPIAHPDGGTIDGLEQDADGNFLVRAIDAPTYFAHGFAVVDEQA